MNRAIITGVVIIALAIFLILEETMSSGKLSYSQLLSLAQGAGFQGQDAVTAAAVALAESGGDPNAYNPEVAALAPPQKGSYGLWQIYLNVHPEFAGQNLNDPATNAAAAFSVYSGAGNSFTPWSTFKSGAYLNFLPSGSASS